MLYFAAAMRRFLVRVSVLTSGEMTPAPLLAPPAPAPPAFQGREEEVEDGRAQAGGTPWGMAATTMERVGLEKMFDIFLFLD